MSDNGAARWNRRYEQADTDQPPKPAAVLENNRHLLPARGTAVDIACGRGGNALLLAAAKLDTSAWDYADAALDKLTAYARTRQLPIACECRDVVQSPPQAASFDVIVVSHFLNRGLAPYLIAALRPGGLLFYQTFISEAATAAGPGNPDYRLQPNELLQLFRPLHLVYYREEGLLGDLDAGFRDQAQYIGCQRP